MYKYLVAGAFTLSCVIAVEEAASAIKEQLESITTSENVESTEEPVG